ncbi:NUDIX hydrolase [Nocardioides humilatus]|uniref:NUDIX hydrolase n=1 Tax=Nocardioides humilatus TaxID=2607660 RepID=A0A5B1L789_9ACTN|nr:NUDIX hydrolase [Nocardioides humilatus]KAA1416344.1 NUDIX hydrolase [Nocardioides humilatus]
MRRFASILLVDPRGWVLLQERDEHPVIDPERWGFVGGHVDPGEQPGDAAYRELEEETGLVIAPPGLPLWREFSVHHAAYGSDDDVFVYAAATTATDDDVVLGEGRQIVFVDPDRLGELPLTASAARILPDFLGSDRFRSLVEEAAIAARNR